MTRLKKAQKVKIAELAAKISVPEVATEFAERVVAAEVDAQKLLEVIESLVGYLDEIDAAALTEAALSVANKANELANCLREAK
jgi:hypothetical protein